MSFFEIAAIFMVLTALFAYLNYRDIKLPTTIGVMAVALVVSTLIATLGSYSLIEVQQHARQVMASINFDEALLHGLLSFLLFAGSLHINLGDLGQQKWAITLLSTVGVILSTVIVGGLTWLLLDLLGTPIPLLPCLLFGALISPTDPVAVIGILKIAGAPNSIETKITGESLFNDGIGVVVFMILLELMKLGGTVSTSRMLNLLLEEAVGGVVLGLAAGYLAFQMLKRVNNYQVEIIITLGLVKGMYALADHLHTSGPISVVVAGLLIGNHGRQFAMSDDTREHLDSFWELMDEILNASLFMLIGLKVLIMEFTPRLFLAGLLAIVITLFARWTSVGGTVMALIPFRRFSPGAVRILTWGGLRGGISVALALSLPNLPRRDEIIATTYLIVIFSIIVQGLSLGRLIKQIYPAEPV